MLMRNVKVRCPHVVILGAGASCAAIPNGDKNGHMIQTMSGFTDDMDLPLLNKVNLHTTSTNLEDIYSELNARASEPECCAAMHELDSAIRKKIASYVIPDTPTIYDYLILGLTSKDLIATFNWDPLLTQAYIRCQKITSNLPHLCFLHGNVSMGVCLKDKVIGPVGGNCPYCQRRYNDVPLMYPIKEKNYGASPYIRAAWNEIRNALRSAYIVTIFGYSAPTSDSEAISLLREAWGESNERKFEQIQIIGHSKGKEKEVRAKWDAFICDSHYDYLTDFFDSYIGQMPRRTCQALWDMTMELQPITSMQWKKNSSFEDVKQELMPLIQDEEQHGESHPELWNDPYAKEDIE